MQIVATLDQRMDLMALINSGVDEIVLALQDFYSGALTKYRFEEIQELTQTIHGLHKTVGLLCTTPLHQSQLHRLDDIKKFVDGNAIDRIYCSDLAFVYAFKERKDFIVYMPDTLLTNAYDILALQSQGIKTMISPLLTFEEMMEIFQQAKGAMFFGHGHTILSFSYRKLLTAYQSQVEAFKARDNKDLYLVELKRSASMPIFEDALGTTVYSDYILASFEHLKAFIEAGASAMFISGLYMDRLAYFEAIQTYRKMMDGIGDDHLAYIEKYKALPIESGYYDEKTVR